MHFQPDRYSCAVYAISNASEALGHHVAAPVIRRAAGTRSRIGTTSRGLYRAVKAIGLTPHRYWTTRPDPAWRWLHRWSSTQPIVVYLGSLDHYVAVVGRAGLRVIVIDSDPQLHRLDNGAHALTRREFLQSWNYRGLYWAIRVSA
jgi:hypothetical protein